MLRLALLVAVVILLVLPWPPLPRERLHYASLVACLQVHARGHASAAPATRPRQRQLGLLLPCLYKAVLGTFLLTSDL